jgi:hypothetical protein
MTSLTSLSDVGAKLKDTGPSNKTYREDIYRMLTDLIERNGEPLTRDAAVHAAVELGIALETALKKHESELRELEMRKQELQEISKQQHFRPVDGFSISKILKRIKEVIEASMSIVASIEKRWLLVDPPIALVVSSLYGVIEGSEKLMERGGIVGIITDISYPYIESAQQHLDVGEDIRHYDQPEG